jgi:Domain of unknown function (DUF6046)
MPEGSQYNSVLRRSMTAETFEVYKLAAALNAITVKVLKTQKLQIMPVEINNNPFMGQIPTSPPQDKDLGYKSPLGTWVVSDLKLVGGSYTNHENSLVRSDDVTLINVLINVSQSKHIVCTEIPGMDDYQIDINGAFNGPNGVYPVNEVNVLNALCIALVPVEVVSRYLQNLDIHSPVIKSYSFDQEVGGVFKTKFFYTGYFRYARVAANELKNNYFTFRHFSSRPSINLSV